MVNNWLDNTIKKIEKLKQRKTVKIRKVRLSKSIEIIKDNKSDLHYKIKEDKKRR